MHRHIAMLQQATQAPVDLPATDIRQEDVEDHCDETLVLQQGDSLLAGAAVHAGETMGLGLLGDHRGKVGVVLDDQHGRATARTLRRGIGRIVLAPGRLQGQHRQTHDEARALPRSTLQADLPAQYLDQLASDGQPQPGTTEAPAGGAVDLLEGLEDALMLRRVCRADSAEELVRMLDILVVPLNEKLVGTYRTENLPVTAVRHHANSVSPAL